MKPRPASDHLVQDTLPGRRAVSPGVFSASRTIVGAAMAALLAAALVWASAAKDARAGCDAATFDPAVDNCATLFTSVTDNAVFYDNAGPSAAISFHDTTCASPPCAVDNSAAALHGTVSNTGDGAFTYTFNDNSYSGI